MKFTDRYILNLKAADKMQDIREGDGFGVRVLPSGVKTFFFLYRFDGKRRFLNLGHYDPTPGAGTLAQARKAYIENRNIVNGGVDPMATKENAARERRAAPTMAMLCEEYMEHHGAGKKSGHEDGRMINVEILPRWSRIEAKEKVLREYRERVLNHTLEKMDNTHNQHDYDDIKQGALSALERKIKSILEPATMADVVDINRARGLAV